MASTIKKLLFIDTNMWLDFYRPRNRTGLALLERLESVSDKIIVTYQLESEYKSNRQRAILEGMKELKVQNKIPSLGVFSDAVATKALNAINKKTEQQVKKLNTRLTRMLQNPAQHDPVYKACQKIFHKADKLNLTRENDIRHIIRRKAFRRFLHGCPPRKQNDTSIGDAINWEWMISCALSNNAELVIVTRDTDYGVNLEGVSYINDHLKQEFSERVSKKRKILLYTHISEALEHFHVSVPANVKKDEIEAEARKKAARQEKSAKEGDFGWIVELLKKPSDELGIATSSANFFE